MKMRNKELLELQDFKISQEINFTPKKIMKILTSIKLF